MIKSGIYESVTNRRGDRLSSISAINMHGLKRKKNIF